MRIYLAARYDRREDLQDVAAALEEQGHEIASSWIDTTDDVDDNTLDNKQKAEWAEMDINDITNADAFVLCSEQNIESQLGRNGRLYEAGFFHGMISQQQHATKSMFILGNRETCQFTQMDEWIVAKDIDHLIDLLDQNDIEDEIPAQETLSCNECGYTNKSEICKSCKNKSNYWAKCTCRVCGDELDGYDTSPNICNSCSDNMALAEATH